jgi:hypothetical protein
MPTQCIQIDMDLPSGEKVELGILLSKFKLEKTLAELAKTEFSGYVNVTIDNVTGIEEGTLLFRNGKITASIYEYGKLKVINYGETAFQECMNAFHAKNGVVDIYQLTKQQAELIVAFTEKMKVDHEVKDLKKQISAGFSEKFNAQAMSKAQGGEQSKVGLMKKFGFMDIEK